MAQPVVAVGQDFLTSLFRLPRKVQQKTASFMIKFRADPTSPGIHLERVESRDGKLYSARVDDTYRAIVAHQDKSQTYVLLWVDHHDEAYDWARRRRCEVNDVTGTLQVYEVDEVEVPEEVPSATPLFAGVTDEQLLALGVPREQLGLVRSLASVDDFYGAKDKLPADAFEHVEWLANGFTYEETLSAIKDEGAESAPITDDMGEALKRPSSLRSFVVVKGEEELLNILSSPLDMWRTFLHPSQRRLVERSYNGPARVLGGAGTGKTVVAMHRAKALASRCPAGKRVLFTTFSTNLAADIQANLKKICTTEELRRIEVINLDAWVARFLDTQGFGYRVTYDAQELESIWEDAAIEAGGSLDLEPSFYADEWSQVILAQDDLTLEEYVHAKRPGRGNKLRRKQRMEVWEVVECYRRLMRERSIRDVDAAMRDARLVLEQEAGEPPYWAIVVDEGQDFSAPAYRLIRALAGEEHSNDIFIVGDAHQRIYGKKAVLSRCGINIRGRASRLRINYRTPEKIRRAAMGVIAGLDWDDLNGDVDDDDVTQSLVLGGDPEVKACRDVTNELDWIAEQVKGLVADGLNPEDICVVLRTNKLVDDYVRGLKERGIDTLSLKARKEDDRSVGGVRVATMHRVKGLEFDSVFLANMSRGVVPPPYALKKARQEGNEDAVLQEERSLIYVAMTRAKRSTTISSAGVLTDLLQGIGQAGAEV